MKDEQYEKAIKVEPKFHEGEWVIDNNGKVAIIYDLQNAGYVGHYTNGTDFVCKYDNEHLLHLWTINDATEGDVLTTQGSVFIFKHLDKTGRSLCKSYCEVIDNSGLGLGFEFSINGVCPATKEQRDLLFAKMKEAGYEWSEKTHELKKIDVELTDFEKSLKHIMIETLECGDTRNLKADAEMLLRLAQKPAWKEDDTLLDLLHKMPSCITVNGIDYHFVMAKTIAYETYYEGVKEGCEKTIFWTGGDPVDILTEMLEKLKEKGLLE